MNTYMNVNSPSHPLTTSFTHTLSCPPLAHTIVYTQICHAEFFAHNSVTHHLCLTPSFTHHLRNTASLKTHTHSFGTHTTFLTHHLSDTSLPDTTASHVICHTSLPHTICHTRHLSHKTLSHTALSHTFLSHRTLWHTIFYT